MIPVRLEISHFLSYRKRQTLDFGSIHLAGISGQNGAGKSTLLEAMTWALFGQSRTRSDDDIVNRMSAREGERAEVQFTFELDGQLYRIVRRKKAGGRMTLEFQMQRDADNWSTLSESKTRETQAKIESTLGMNYDTFVNVSFFLQGQADEFTTKTAGQRKEILAELLGVNRWDEYKEKATEARKSAENQLNLTDHRISEIDNELLEADERAARLQANQSDLDSINAQLETQTVLLTQLRRAADQAAARQKEVAQRSERLSKEKERQQTVTSTLAERKAERDKFQSLLDQKEAIEQAQKEYETALQAFEGWQVKADANNKLQQAIQPHEVAIAATRSRLTQQQSELAAQSEKIAAMQSEATTLAATLSEKQTEQEKLGAISAELTQKEAAFHTAREQLQTLTSARQLLQQEANQLQSEASQHAKQQSERQRLESELSTVQAKLTDLQTQATQLVEKKSELATMQATQSALLTVDQPRLKEQMARMKERIERLNDVAEGVCPVCGQELTDTHRAQVIEEVKREGKTLGDDYRDNQRRLAEIVGSISKLESVIRSGGGIDRELQAQQQRLASAEARIAESTRAATAWAESGKAARLDDLNKQLADESAFKSQQQVVDRLAADLKQKSDIDKQLQSLQQSLAQMTARSAEIARRSDEWTSVGSKELEAVSGQLSEGAFEPDARAALAVLQAELKTLGYDADAHAAARAERDQLAAAAKQYTELISAEAALKPLNSGISDLEQQLVQLEESTTALNQELEDGRAQLAALQLESADLRSIEAQVNSLRTQQNEANRQVGSAQQRVAILDDQRANRKERLAEREAITDRIAKLKMLEKACGRDGIQALLIERALPEIEDSANELLDRLTDGVMRVAFETQRQLKTSDALRETLDISIMDSSGDRPYENFSGGEKFRINFAIRLALSQILSKRAGARLQTLVIDEGFGSQDPLGRQRLVEAIKTIEKDFACILVITHVEELRDAFEDRIEISKSAEGSVLRIA